MKRYLLCLLLLLAASPGWARPRVETANNLSRTQNYAITFTTGDTSDTKEIEVSGFCSVRYTQEGSDTASLYAVTSKEAAASSGTLIGAFTASTTTATTFTAGTRWVKAVATDATAGGSVMTIDCAPLTGGTGGGAEFDACRNGTVQGGGYDAADGRWAWTCGNFNWHGWRDSTQATASYDVTCTGDGTPHTSCIHAGEVRHIGYPVHRTALAAQYTKDGGKVYLPEGLYVDNGALYLQDGTTRAKYPDPYDPEWEARADFDSLGYPTGLQVVVLNRGVRLIGEGIPTATRFDPSDPTITDDAPKLAGTWIVDDRGTAVGAPGTGNTNTGETGIISPISQYRMLVGYNTTTAFCRTTGDDDPTCVTDTDDNEQDVPGVSVWGAHFSTLANFDASVASICVPDATSSIGTGQDDAIGTCSLNRMIRCWDDTTASEPRSSGGCDFGAGGDFGACQAPYEALTADYVTASQDLQLAMHITECPDNATSNAHCTSAEGEDIYIVDIDSAPGATLAGGASCDSGNGTTVDVGIAHSTAPPATFNPGIPFPIFYVGGSGATNRIFPVARNSMDGRGAGFENIGRMPANWLTRNSDTAAADCLSGGSNPDIDTSDDEVACDTDTLAGFALSYNNLIGPNNLFFKISQAHGVKSGVVESFPSGGGNDFIGNTIDTHYRQTVVDWGSGNYAYNKHYNLNAWGSDYGFAACYSGDCRFIGNEIRNSTVSYAFISTLAAERMLVRDTIYQNVGHSEPLHYVLGGKNYEVYGEKLEGTWHHRYAKISPGGITIQKPRVVFSGTRGYTIPLATASNATTGGGTPNAVFLFEGDDTADANPDDWKSVLIDDVHFYVDSAEPCFAWFEDDLRGSSGAAEDTASLAAEATGRVAITNSSINSLTTGVGAKIACTSAFEYETTAHDASDADNWAVEPYAPTLFNNYANNVRQADMMATVSQATVLNADVLPHGTVVRVYDGASGCAHTGGDLDSGSAVVTCVNDQAADTWAEWP